MFEKCFVTASYGFDDVPLFSADKSFLMARILGMQFKLDTVYVRIIAAIVR